MSARGNGGSRAELPTPDQLPRPTDEDVLLHSVQRQGTQVAELTGAVNELVAAFLARSDHIDRLHKLVVECREDVRRMAHEQESFRAEMRAFMRGQATP